MKLDSLTVLDYIRTSIEILMHLKNDGEGEADKRDGARSFRPRNEMNEGETDRSFESQTWSAYQN